MHDLEFKPASTLGEVVATSDGSLTLSHPEHGQCYHTRAGALAEARHLYVEASGLLDLWQAGREATCVLDVGLGLGYTAIATLAAWRAAANPGDLHVISLEINPDLVPAIASMTAPWQANWPEEHLLFCRELRQISPHQWETVIAHPSAGATARWEIKIGDAATEAVPPAPLPGGYTHVWQDPFSPGKNPPLWQAEWFRRLRAEVTADCQMMTYSVAAHVRAALEETSWAWEKIPASMPGQRKRHWLRARPKNSLPL